jgi:type IV pilus assembly protein PilE
MPAAAASRRALPAHSGEHGFTLIELLIVLIVVGILTMIALPSYFTFRTRAYDSTAKSNLAVIANTISSYYADNTTFVGMTLAGLKATYDQGLNTSGYILPAADLSSTSYCVQATSGTRTWRKNGPAAQLENLTCP